MIKNEIQFAVLTGGKSSRFGGNKLNHTINGKTILEYTLDTIGNCSNLPILLIGKKPKVSSPHYEFHKDINLGLGPLRGIYTALHFSSAEYVFIIAGDMPYIKKDLLDFILSFVHINKDAILCINKGFYEPLFAVYKKSVKQQFEICLKEERYKISDALKNIDKMEIAEKLWGPYDPFGTSFRNINTPGDIIKDKPISYSNKVSKEF
jgi:molybdopterin-guanine dinucleotide biosynthesis protein A